MAASAYVVEASPYPALRGETPGALRHAHPFASAGAHAAPPDPQSDRVQTGVVIGGLIGALSLFSGVGLIGLGVNVLEGAFFGGLVGAVEGWLLGG